MSDGARMDDEVAEAAAGEPPATGSGAVSRLEDRLLGGKRELTRKEAAASAGVSTKMLRKFWRALGLPRIPDGQAAYTHNDVAALAGTATMVTDGIVDEETAVALLRAVGQTTDRLTVWQMETLVEYLSDTKGRSENDARAEAVELFDRLVEPMQSLLDYAWRRNLANSLGRLSVNVEEGLAMENRTGWYDSAMPLARVVGFVDMVSYTRLSQQLEPRQLAFMVKRFQDLAYNVVASGGGRVIKTVGDEVFFAAETPMSGAQISMTLMERIRADDLLPKARLGFAWGKVLSRMGDVFGSTVNLAARLTAVTEPGTVLTDWDTAQVLARSDAYAFGARRALSLQGLGEVSVVEMTRGTAGALDLDLDDGIGEELGGI
ncbi:adenylate/guanylate cyclase domain-containing protein [Brevibacterium sp. 91QC2O2]|uniref:adenylate/guanylate cyclase domain-containing protein n=1 Tax=Brevibacterium TaxID=1696 RepID=UPI00211C294B|nr:adenylate/guanylate cyclase domain-containing protein [Brevibacterium sp. 91QC2O2]MCQ9385950.1 adenylate/guanylate cyclase domain-containing protein [Brevibacterium sp. 68QC2CO]